MQEAMQVLGRVLSMLTDVGTEFSTVIETLRRFLAEMSKEDENPSENPEDSPSYEEKEKEGKENEVRSYSWDEVSETLNVLAEHRTAFDGELLEFVDSLLLASRDDLGYGVTKAKYPDAKDTEDEEKSPKQKKQGEDYEDYEEKEKAPKKAPMQMSLSELRTLLQDRGRELFRTGSVQEARDCSAALSQLKSLPDGTIIVDTPEELSGLEELGSFFALSELSERVLQHLRTAESVGSAGSGMNATVSARAGDRDPIDQFAVSLRSLLTNGELSRSAKLGAAQALFNGLGEVVPDLIAASTPATERDLVDVVRELLPGALEQALRSRSSEGSPQPSAPTSQRRSLTPTPWSPTLSGAAGMTPRDIARLTT